MCASKSTPKSSRQTTPVDRLRTLSALLPSVDTKHLTLKVWLCVFVYAMLAGLAIQLVILPYVFPQLHAGNGLLAGRDWVGFHEQAVAHALRIAEVGWGEFRLRPDGDNAITGIAAFFYYLFWPKPWTLLPLSAAMFATGGVALFSMLKHLDLEDNEALIAILPYLVFPSALLQYGQIHKDVFCTAGVLVALWSWVNLLRGDRKAGKILPMLAASAIALIVLSVFRPYFMYPFMGLGVVLLLWHVIRVAWQFFQRFAGRGQAGRRASLIFNLQSVGILVLLNAFVYVMANTYIDLRMKPISAQPASSGAFVAKLGLPVFTWQSNKDVRSADTVRLVVAGEGSATSSSTETEAAIRKAIEECRPIVVLKDGQFVENMINRAFLKIAVARAGFTSSGGTTAASNIDKGIDFCRNKDLVAYIPRAMQIAFFAPFPSKWASVEKRNSSSVEIYISAVEMFYCYIAYIGLLYWLCSYHRWNVALLIPVGFSLGMMLLLGLTVANVGTLYRMRFPFAMIFVSIGMAGILQLAKIRPPWVEKLDSNAD
jgi:hypothetical protein